MNQMHDEKLEAYYRDAESWSADREAVHASSRRLMLIMIGILAAIALTEGIALILLVPLKTTVPYTLLVDKQTGYVQELKPLEREKISADSALTRSLLVQYVIAREGFDVDSLRDSYRKVALWSADEARAQYLSVMQANNPASPLASLPRRALVHVEIRSVSSLSANTAMVRFTTTRTDPGGEAQAPQAWAAVISYRFSAAAMSAADRLGNPLGFQVVRYRRDAEMLPADVPTDAQAQPAAGPVRPALPAQPQPAPSRAPVVRRP